jgi:hypothetical protein
MTASLVFSLIGILGLLLVLYLAAGYRRPPGGHEGLAARLRPVDVNAFRNLIDVRERSFLRAHLPRREFRSLNRQRMLAASEYVWCAAQNAGVLMQLAEEARRDEDPAVAAAAEKLLDNALRLRLYAFELIPRLYLSMWFPEASLESPSIADSYDSMTRQVVTLSCLHQPAQALAHAL